MSTPLQFTGSVPQHYQDILTPFLFDSFSVDLVQRIGILPAGNVLELASGTGSVTRLLVANMPAGAHLTATDLQAGMLEVAKSQLSAANLAWEVVDMTNIPYADETYDLIVCQFAVMLVPEKLKALSEMHRVLKKGGRLVFSVWASIGGNPVWEISGKVIETFLGSNTMLQDPGPFSLSAETDVRQLLQQAGFTGIESTLVTQTGQAESAAIAAKGFINGLPVFMAISQRGPAVTEQVQQELESRFITQLGDHPLQSQLTAWVFDTIK